MADGALLRYQAALKNGEKELSDAADAQAAASSVSECRARTVIADVGFRRGILIFPFLEERY